MKTILMTLAVIAVMAPLAADALEVSVQVGGEAMIVPSKGYDPFSQNDNLGAGSLALGVRPFGRGPLRGLGFELGYAGGTAGDRLWSTFDANLTLNMLNVGASYRWGRFDWFAPYVRLLGTVAWGDVQITKGMYGDLDDHATAFGGSLALGFELCTPRAWLRPDDEENTAWWRPASLGVYLEGGYGKYGALSFSRAGAAPITADDVHKTVYDVAGPALGSLDLSGPTIRAGFVANF